MTARHRPGGTKSAPPGGTTLDEAVEGSPAGGLDNPPAGTPAPHVAADATTARMVSQIPSMLDELSALYPELAADVITDALEGAHLAAVSLAAGARVSETRLRTLACDRLDVALARASARYRPEQRCLHGRPSEHGLDTVACTYCRASIPACEFSIWSQANRLRSASCPRCCRRVTILSATWRRQTDRRQAPSGGAGQPRSASA